MPTSSLRVYNTLTRQKEEFKPVHPGKVAMYVCGPTVYKPSHIGHMVGPVIFDTVRRYLQYLGYQVRFVVNITDVDDKLIVRSRELGTSVKELAEKMTLDYLDCLKRLGVDGITDMPKATEHIGEMLHMISRLIEKGYAYPAGGDVYFDVTRDADYGKLCHRDPEQMEAGARIEVSERKRNPGDFALWKSAKPGEPSWESPWGPGRPGWHIECSAMSMKYLGQTLDIHGGGLDLQFPHHENELAQSESYTDKPFARYWMHNGLLKMGKSKMAGSVGNVVNVQDLLQKHHSETIRFLLLNTHYRSPIEYNEERLQELSRSLESFHRFFDRFGRITGNSFFKLAAPTRLGTFDADGDLFLREVGRLREQFLDAMADDFNTGGAVGVLFELLTALNRFADDSRLEYPNPNKDHVAALERGTAVLKELAQILELFREPRSATSMAAGASGAASADNGLVIGLRQLLTDLGTEGKTNDTDKLMQQLIALRAEARKARNFVVADLIRRRLAELKVNLEDRPGGTGWRVG
jgi:cysteinyl-tRNA synthetase